MRHHARSLFIVGALVAALAGSLPAARADSMLTPIAVDSSPRVIRVAPNGKLYVADRLPDQVSVIDPTTNAVVATVAVGLEPGAIHIGNDGRVYVPNRVSNTISVIDSNTDTVIGQPILVGLRPAAIDTPLDNSKVVVVNERSGSVTILKGADLTEITTLPVAPSKAPHALVVTPSGARAYIADEATNDVAVIDLTAVPPVLMPARIAVGLGPGSMRIVRDDAHGRDVLFVANQKDGTVSLIDISPGTATTDTVVATAHVGDAPHGLAEEGSMVLVANEASGTVTALSAAGDFLRTIDLRVRPGDPSGLPQRIHVTKDGKRAYVPNEGENTVSVIDLASLTLVDTIPVGSAPTTLDISRGEVFVGNRDSNTVSVIAIQQDSAAATSTPVVTETPRPTRTPLPGETPSPTAADGVTGAAATPPPDGQPVPTDPSAIDPALPVTTGSTTPTHTAGAGTPTAGASPTAVATRATGSIATDAGSGDVAGVSATPEQLSASGGAPSWVWLAAALGALAVLTAAGYAGRGRIASYASRMRK